MSDRHEERIDTVVQAMRQAEPPAGMERRLLARLQSAQVTQPQTRPVWWALPLPRYALAGAVIAATTGLLLQHQAVQGRTHGASPSAYGSRAGAEKNRPHIVSPGDLAAHPSSVAPAPHPVARLIPVRSGVQTKLSIGKPLVPSGDDDRSFPAPTLPLTEQERLLVRLVRHEPPRQLAELSASAQDSLFQQEKEHVAEYFAKPVAPVDPPYDAGQQ